MANVKRPQALVLGRAEPHIEACLQVAEIPCSPQSLGRYGVGIVKVAIPTNSRELSEFRLGLDCLSSSGPKSTRNRLPEEQFPPRDAAPAEARPIHQRLRWRALMIRRVRQ